MALGTHQRHETYPRLTRDGLNSDIKASSGTPLEKLSGDILATSRQTSLSLVAMIQSLLLLVVSTFYKMGTQRYPGECPLGSKRPLAVPCVGGDAGPGTIDIEALKVMVDFFSAKGHPILVIFNYGTTFKGAYDDVQAASEALLKTISSLLIQVYDLHRQLLWLFFW